MEKLQCRAATHEDRFPFRLYFVDLSRDDLLKTKKVKIKIVLAVVVCVESKRTEKIDGHSFIHHCNC